MRTLTSRRILHRWETLRTSYYFVPILMILAAAIAAIDVLFATLIFAYIVYRGNAE